MTNEIKLRINQINRGEVPQGYKKTEVGIVPAEWEIKRLDEISNIYDGTHETPKYRNKGVKFVSVEDIKNISQSNKYISYDDYYKYKIKPKMNDILMTRMTAGIIGDTAIVENNNPLAYYVSLSLIRCDNNENVNYVNAFIQGIAFKKELNKRIIHTAFPKKINLNDIGKCLVILPKQKEQQHIAEILSKLDEAIAMQEKLIEKLELKKKALMQKLLMPQKSWNSCSLENCCEINKGDQINSEDLLSNAPYKMINGGILESGYTDNYNRNANTLIISEGGNSCGYVNYIKEPFWCGGHCYSLENVKIDKLFLYYYLKNIEKLIMKFRVGSGLPNIQKETLAKLEIYYPREEEMKSFSEVLYLLDQNIGLQTKKLTKIKQQQKAMQQLLLTGIVRV